MIILPPCLFVIHLFIMLARLYNKKRDKYLNLIREPIVVGADGQ